jgi:hypothetical protein
MYRLRFTGLTGLAITLAVNLVALLVLKKAEAEFFSPPWWSLWYPNYLVWSILMLIGFVARKRSKAF